MFVECNGYSASLKLLQKEKEKVNIHKIIRKKIKQSGSVENIIAICDVCCAE